MASYFKLHMCYPNGRIEEIDEMFKTARDAFDYGQNMLMQSANTERFHGGDDESKSEPSFTIYEIQDGVSRLRYDSRG